jgi:hypothetical protein
VRENGRIVSIAVIVRSASTATAGAKTAPSAGITNGQRERELALSPRIGPVTIDLGTIAADLGVIAVFVLWIIGQLIWLIRIWRRSGLENPNWTSSDRKHVRTLRTIMLVGVAAGWAILLAQFARHPDVTYGPKFHSLAVLALLLTSLTLMTAFIGPRRSSGGLWFLMIVGTVICAFLVGTGLIFLGLTWTDR